MKHDMHWNPEEEQLLGRPLAKMRVESGAASGRRAAIEAMLARPRSAPQRPVARYMVLAAACAAMAGVAIWPRPSSAVGLAEVAKALREFRARHDRVYRPDSSGKLVLAYEQWAEPGKLASVFAEGTENRSDGKLVYSYSPQTNRQRIAPGSLAGIDPVGVEEYERSPYGKLERLEREGSGLRYVFQMGATRQDLIVDSHTKLPIRREVFYPADRLMEVHEYEFLDDIPDAVFEPHLKPSVPLTNVPKDRHELAQQLAAVPRVATVAGIDVRLHAVIIASNNTVGAVVTGGAPRGSRSKEGLVIPGQTPILLMTDGAYSVWEKLPHIENTLVVDGQFARVEAMMFKGHIPERFTLRVPVWKEDASLPLRDPKTGVRLGSDAKLVGWAEFEVTKPIRSESIEPLLPNYVPPNGTESATASAR